MAIGAILAVVGAILVVWVLFCLRNALGGFNE